MQGTKTAFDADPNALAMTTGNWDGPVNQPTYAATMTLDPTTGPYLQVITTAIGAATLNAASGGYYGQEWEIEIANDAGGARTITFGTNFRPSATVVGTASKSIIVRFRSNGVAWLETHRGVAV
jgi:hypothetical protein